ncbi:hypothetical protein ABZV31_26305 [Streptomyces sp. NPDC005202]|uniref:hypothetical protein n=1 Tax=Streptomyces sp. NPDC005202 TaxID=3157021 RepID=UPI0033BE51D3
MLLSRGPFGRPGRGRDRVGPGVPADARDETEMPAVCGMTTPHRSGIEHALLYPVHDQQQNGHERQQQNSDNDHGVPLGRHSVRVLRTVLLMGSDK